MLESLKFFAKTPAMTPGHDPFDDALRDLRVAGSLLLHEHYTAPWAIDIPEERQLRSLLGVAADLRVALFHFVRRGSFDLSTPGGEVVTLTSPQVAICFAGEPHRMSAGCGARPVSVEQVLRGLGPADSAHHVDGETELVCGAFFLNATPLNPLLGALPRLMTVDTSDTSFSPMLANVASMLAHEVDRGALSSFTMGRLLEIFCAELLRAYQCQSDPQPPGWFKGLADPRIAAALGRIHAEPGHAWTVDELARGAALSPSRFAARFRAATGIAAMTYVARWRAHVACRLLQDASLSLTDIAHTVGYDSQPAFTRAFKAHTGQPPAAWRSARLSR